ncbi:Putative transposase [Paraburkholderia xenovorans LB400]|uniref:Transposase n=1 Tax=Paraburkholderia xenovorans (strain LB400) TaxID=266265 RepID=Q13RK7_PARXL|nr:Putative transposase [Paraburkholderia xenovorans LB400]ABE28703.1 transposase, IS4 family [Paraburkholderia xenovorans LB400]ABE29475.1 Putative transposase [Paraburkholderia xenovorans LB400]ABE30490.1 transposase, IS4 family [Paraburkholderia xenovorans LB400]ABE32370.1 transposase, IS4 family [Paraburkholderia xenovorans LB400]
MWFRHSLLATARRVAKGRCLATHSRSVARRTASPWRNRFLACARRQLIDSRRAGGKKTGPNPTDRRKLGSKHHLIVDAQGIPLAVILSAANRHDITQLDALVDAIPRIRGKRGRPLHKPRIVQGDRGYSSEPHRQRLRERGITPLLAKVGAPHGSGLGKTRWPVERSIAWLHSFRRLKIRYERYAHVHEAFLSLACALICWTRLKPLFN